MFKGSYVALATPFTANDSIDFDTYGELVNWQIGNGTHGLVPCGTTGETPVLSHEEHMALIDQCVKVSAGRVPVIAGAGSNSTRHALHLAQEAQKAGADAILTVVPYYNKPCQEGIYQHFKFIHDNTDIPLILYNVPGRTVASLNVDTVSRLSHLPRVRGIKDASPDLSRPAIMRRDLGPDFALLSGEDATVGAYLGQGGDGCISVTANAVPEICSALHRAWQNQEGEAYCQKIQSLMALHDLMFSAPNPAPVKYALYRRGIFKNFDVRLPLVNIGKDLQARIDRALEKLEL